MASDPASMRGEGRSSDMPAGRARPARVAGFAGADAASRARPMTWPTVDQAMHHQPLDEGRAQRRNARAAGDQTLPAWLRTSHLLPLLAAEMMAALGIRLRLRVDRSAREVPAVLADMVSLGSIDCASGRLHLAIDGDAAIELLAAAFGSDRSAGPPETVQLCDLAPGNASWAAMSALVRRAASRALKQAGAGNVTDRAPTLADASLPRMHVMRLLLAGPGLQLAMELLFLPAPPPERDAMPDSDPKDRDQGVRAVATGQDQATSPDRSGDPLPDPWKGRLDALSRTVPVAVGLELCAIERPLAEIMDLAVGDVIHLPPIDTMVMKVAGEPWRELPLAALGGRGVSDDAGEGQP